MLSHSFSIFCFVYFTFSFSNVFFTSSSKLLEISGLFADNKKIKVISGGEVRSKSVAAALCEVDEKADYILVHDAARCFATQAQTMRVINALLAGDHAVVPGIEVIDTIKVIDSNNSHQPLVLEP